jgi:DNA polymerase elongation subunit (family B)
MYVKSEVRKGLLGRMLSELLRTRMMVKQAMKETRDKVRIFNKCEFAALSLPYLLATSQDVRCSTAWPKIYCKRNLRVYECQLLWTYASR